MSKTLVAFASKKEFNILFPKISAVVASTTPQPLNTAADMAVCGVGLLDFSVNLARILSQGIYDRVFQVGICGAYPGRDIEVGEVVRVDSEIVGDLGVQDRNGHFVPWGDVCGSPATYAGDSPRFLTLPLATIRSVSGVSVNCCTGTAYLASRRSALFEADVETMEGAACFAVCKRFGVSCYQFRAVSNIATDRDISTWKIEEALVELKRAVIDNL